MSNGPDSDVPIELVTEPPENGMLLLAGTIGAAIVGALYAVVSLTVPIFFWGGLLYPVLTGAIIGGWVIQTAKWTHVPEGRTAVLGVLGCTLAGWYVHWIVWCAAVTNEGLRVLPWSLAGTMARAANECPLTLFISGATVVVVGAERWVLWGLEAATIFGTAWMVAAMYWPLGHALGFFTGFFVGTPSGGRHNRRGGRCHHRRFRQQP